MSQPNLLVELLEDLGLENTPDNRFLLSSNRCLLYRKQKLYEYQLRFPGVQYIGEPFQEAALLNVELPPRVLTELDDQAWDKLKDLERTYKYLFLTHGNKSPCAWGVHTLGYKVFSDWIHWKQCAESTYQSILYREDAWWLVQDTFSLLVPWIFISSPIAGAEIEEEFFKYLEVSKCKKGCK